MNNDEVFTTVRTHLLTQNKQAKLEGVGCRYRTPEGLKCAIGCLIKDEDYSPVMEGMGLCRDNSELATALKNNGVDLSNPSTQSLLIRLQTIHDSCSVDFWPDLLSSDRHLDQVLPAHRIASYH